MPKVNKKLIQYNYGINFLALAPNITVTGSISIEADADFRARKTTYQADVVGLAQAESTRVIPLCTFQITDTATARNLSNIQIPVTSYFGTGERPFILPVPRIYRANSVLSFSVTNVSQATTYNLRLVLIGEKLML